MKHTVTKMKNTLEGINSRLDEADQISDLEDKLQKTYNQNSKKKKNLKK